MIRKLMPHRPLPDIFLPFDEISQQNKSNSAIASLENNLISAGSRVEVPCVAAETSPGEIVII